jgi:hypothetical protein
MSKEKRRQIERKKVTKDVLNTRPTSFGHKPIPGEVDVEI